MAIATPQIDAAIISTPYRAERFEAAKNTLEKGLAEGSIFNVDWKNAKDAINSALERALEPAYARYWEVNRAAIQSNSNSVPDYSAMSYHVMVHQVNGMIKRLQKFRSNPEVAAFLDILNEAKPLADAVATLKEKIVMGRKPNPNAQPVDTSNMGRCAICQRHQKLTAGKKLVHHGFQISLGGGQYLGYRNGSCFGTNRDPYEVSCAANKAWIEVVEDWKKAAEGRVAELQSGSIIEISKIVRKRVPGTFRSTDELVTYKAGDKEWSAVLDREIRDTQFKIKGFDMEIERQQELVSTWKAQPLA